MKLSRLAELQEQARAEVLNVRGSEDAPGFEPCVEAAFLRLLQIEILHGNDTARLLVQVLGAIANGYWFQNGKAPIRMTRENQHQLARTALDFAVGPGEWQSFKPLVETREYLKSMTLDTPRNPEFIRFLTRPSKLDELKDVGEDGHPCWYARVGVHGSGGYNTALEAANKALGN